MTRETKKQKLDTPRRGKNWCDTVKNFQRPEPKPWGVVIASPDPARVGRMVSRFGELIQ